MYVLSYTKYVYTFERRRGYSDFSARLGRDVRETHDSHLKLLMGYFSHKCFKLHEYITS